MGIYPWYILAETKLEYYHFSNQNQLAVSQNRTEAKQSWVHKEGDNFNALQLILKKKKKKSEIATESKQISVFFSTGYDVR